MKRSIILFLTTILTLSFISAIIPINAESYDITKDNYYVWSTWSMEEKVAYVLGFMSGITGYYYELHEKILFISSDEEVRNLIPSYTLRDYITTIEYIYEIPDYRAVAVWLIMFRLDYFFQLRREYERRNPYK